MGAPGMLFRSVICCPSEAELGGIPLSGAGVPASPGGIAMGDELGTLSPGTGESVDDGGDGDAPSSLEQPLTPSVRAAPTQR